MMRREVTSAYVSPAQEVDMTFGHRQPTPGFKGDEFPFIKEVKHPKSFRSHLILIVLLRVVEKFVIGLDIPLPTPCSLLFLLVRVEVDVRVLAIFDRRPRRTAAPSSVR